MRELQQVKQRTAAAMRQHNGRPQSGRNRAAIGPQFNHTEYHSGAICIRHAFGTPSPCTHHAPSETSEWA